ncbi:MAG TPA: BNR repeat-containing protein [Pyrinomonadaceae bacterium]|nr:BNR repeat-containing protein [Pyrinomonadaceae bacterium]
MRLRRKTDCASLIVGLVAASISAQVRIVPIAEGWARNQINTVIFRRNSVTSFGDFQYAGFYDAESRVVIARRKLGRTKWEIKATQFTGNTADAHNSISVAVDGHGVLHVSWDNHNTPLRYARSATPGSLELKETAMIGDREAKVTYPEFFNMPNGDLLFLYRDGSSGNGNLVLNRYDVKSREWTRVQNNLIDGENVRNAYPQTTVDSRGSIHISWVWRESPDVATNHDLGYARSDDGGRTWVRSNGEKYQPPITAATAEYVWRIPQNSELINQTSMTADANGRPYIATYWRDKDVPQFRLVYFDGSSWKSSQISHRTQPFTLSGGGTKRIPISRPQVVVKNRAVFVIYRDAERGGRATIASTMDLARWSITDLGENDLGMWEPTFDQSLWTTRGELHLFVQKAGQGDGERLEQLPPQMISILEWRQRK